MAWRTSGPDASSRRPPSSAWRSKPIRATSSRSSTSRSCSGPQGKLADARDLLQRAVTVDPRHPGSHYNLAVVADESGNAGLAISHYRTFLKLGAVAAPGPGVARAHAAHGARRGIRSAVMADPRKLENAEYSDLLREDRAFPPPAAFRASAHVSDDSLYAEAERDSEGFWARFAGELEWTRPWDRVLDWQPAARQVVRGRHSSMPASTASTVTSRGPRRNKAAIIWEGEPGDTPDADLSRPAPRGVPVRERARSRSASTKGDRVAIYMPLVPELAVAMLACARIGAVHSIVFGGFSAESLRDRINDAQARLLITADGGYRRGQIVPLKQIADEALTGTPVDRST